MLLALVGSSGFGLKGCLLIVLFCCCHSCLVFYSTADVLDALRKKGCLACKCSSHGNKLIKSNASVEEFRSAILTVAKPSA